MAGNLQKSAMSDRLRRGVSRGLIDPGQFFSVFTLRCYRPLANLEPFVTNFWIMRWDPKKHLSPTYQYLRTKPAIEFYLSRHRPYVTGIKNNKMLLTAYGNGVEAGIEFKPGAFRAFWGGDVSTLTNKDMLLEQCFPEVTSSFLNQLYSKDEDVHFVVMLEKLLLDRHPQMSNNLVLIQSIVKRMAQDEHIKVADISREYRLSERMLHYLFTTHVGVGPKWLLMRVRLLRATYYAHTRHAVNWTEIAYDLGYSTQSHFINDFKKYVGLSPSKYMRSIDTDGHLPTL